jgi:hypothetical protein
MVVNSGCTERGSLLLAQGTMASCTSVRASCTNPSRCC